MSNLSKTIKIETSLNYKREPNDSILISVIIPFQKGRHFLEDCFTSLREENLDNVETILVCDHVEEDITAFIYEHEVSLNLTVIKMEEKTGVAAARNAGMEAARGKYLYFLDSDDYLYNNAIERLTAVITEETPDIVYAHKKSTWFNRHYFLESRMDKESKDDDQFEIESNDSNKEKSYDNSEDDELDISNAMMEYNNDEDFSGEGIYVEGTIEEDELTRSIREAKRNEKYKKHAINDLLRKRKGLKNISVLNILYKREFLLNHDIHFEEEFYFYSDLTFVLKVLATAESFRVLRQPIYVKRKHNDPINYPAISQEKNENRFQEYIDVYQAAKLINLDKDLRKMVDKKVINYYANYFAPRLRRREYASWKNERFAVMQKALSDLDKDTIRGLKGYKKRIIKALLQGNVRKSLFIINIHLGIRKIKKMRKNKRVLGYYLYFNHFLKAPVKEDLVLLESFFGKSYSDSPKYIYEYLNKHYPGKYKYVWVMNKKTKIPYECTKVKRFSLRYMYYLARSKYFVFNGRQPVWVRKRENTVFLQTWHGTPLKKLVFDQESISSATPLYKQQFYKQSRIWDYLISDNEFSTETFQRAFKFDNDIIESGYPRNDILYSKNKEELIDRIKTNLQLDKSKKVILYAPTWRDDEYYGPGQYKFALKMDLHRMKEELGEEYIILLRTHYFIADALDVTGLEDFAINVSKYDDISELYLISDILITDYSSVFFDYANLKRPILFYTYDLEKYRDMLRGFYLDIEKEVPGPLLLTDEEVIHAVKNINRINLEYKDKYEQFYDRFCSIDDGNASKRIVETVFDV